VTMHADAVDARRTAGVVHRSGEFKLENNNVDVAKICSGGVHVRRHSASFAPFTTMIVLSGRFPPGLWQRHWRCRPQPDVCVSTRSFKVLRSLGRKPGNRFSRQQHMRAAEPRGRALVCTLARIEFKSSARKWSPRPVGPVDDGVRSDLNYRQRQCGIASPCIPW